MVALIAENFLEKPTAFGVPLGALLLFFWVMRAINESKNAGPKETVQKSRPFGSGLRSVQSSAASFRRSTLSIALLGEVDDRVVEFVNSGFRNRQRRAEMQFSVRLHESGTFLVAGGKHQAGRLSASHYGYTMVSGHAGEKISGTVNCPGFSDGEWAIGAFRTHDEISLYESS